MAIFLSAGTYLSVQDLSQRIDGPATSVGGIVLESLKGPVEPTFISSTTDFIKYYGDTTSALGYGHISALAFLQQSSALYVARAINNATYSTLLFYRTSQSPKLLSLTLPTGATSNYESGGKQINTITFSAPIAAGQTINVNLNNSGNPITVTQAFQQTNNLTLALLAEAIQAQLNILGPNGACQVNKVTLGASTKQQLRLSFETELDVTSVVTLTLNLINSAPITPITVPFDTDHYTTIQNLITAINAALPGGSAFLEIDSNDLSIIIQSPLYGASTLSITNYSITGNANVNSISVEEAVPGSGENDDRTLAILNPAGIPLTITSVNITGAAPLPNVLVEEDAGLFEIYAENPGSWGNNLGILINNVDQGVNQNLNLTVTGNFVIGNQIGMSINNNQITPVTFTTDHNTTLGLLATAITNLLVATYGGGSAAVIPAVTGNNTTITITAPDSVTVLNFANLTVVGGASQPTINVIEVLKNIPTSNTFDLNIYTRDNVSVPVESFTVSFGYQLDGFGYQQNLTELVNKSASKSAYIRVYQNTTSYVPIANMPYIVFLGNGTNGARATSSNFKQAFTQFADTEKYDIRILINAGLTDPSIQQYIDAVSQQRNDCLAVLDMPSNVQKAQDAVNYRKNTLNINSSFSALFTPDLQIVDDYKGTIDYVPPSGYIAARLAYTDANAETWFSPAGLNRGVINNVVGLRQRYNKGDMDLMYPSQINPIVSKANAGIVLWGDKTLQAKSSALSYIGVRRLIINIGVALLRTLDFSVFEPNDDFTRTQVTILINNYLQPIADKRGLQAFQVVCDTRNNKGPDIDAGRLNVDVYITPTLSVQYINVKLIITRSGINISDLIQG